MAVVGAPRSMPCDATQVSVPAWAEAAEVHETAAVVSVPFAATAAIGPAVPPVTVKPAVAEQDTDAVSGPAPPPGAPPLMSISIETEPGTDEPTDAPAGKVIVVPPACE